MALCAAAEAKSGAGAAGPDQLCLSLAQLVGAMVGARCFLRYRASVLEERLPPRQTWVPRPIVYDVGPVPKVDLSNFRLELFGEVENPLELSWEGVLALPQVAVTCDFHCVTGWSVKDLAWEGVPARTIVELVRPKTEVAWVMAHGREGYTANVPYEHFSREGGLLALRLCGEPLTPENGYPLRLVIPSLYAWKSVKYLVGLEFLVGLRRGYWETRGYHSAGDPWREERFA